MDSNAPSTETVSLDTAPTLTDHVSTLSEDEQRELASHFTDGGMVVTQVNYTENNPIAQARGPAFLEMLKNAIKNNVRIYVMNDGMDQYWLDQVQDIIGGASNITIVDYSQMTQSGATPAERRRHAVESVYATFPDTTYVYWTEAEKPDLLTLSNLARVGEAIEAGNQVIIPTAKPNDNRPNYMKAIEMRANRRAIDILRNGGKMTNSKEFKGRYQGNPYQEPAPGEEFYDLWFGPFIVSRDIAREYVIPYKDGKIWDWNILPKAKAIVDGASSVSLPVDFCYPESQKQQEEENREAGIKYRKKQYKLILKEFVRRSREALQVENNPQS